MPRKPKPKPKPKPSPVGAELWAVRREHERPIRCPRCGHITDICGYDSGGLDDGDLCCNTCGFIDPMEDLADYSIED